MGKKVFSMMDLSAAAEESDQVFPSLPNSPPMPMRPSYPLRCCPGRPIHPSSCRYCFLPTSSLRPWCPLSPFPRHTHTRTSLCCTCLFSSVLNPRVVLCTLQDMEPAAAMPGHYEVEGNENDDEFLETVPPHQSHSPFPPSSLSALEHLSHAGAFPPI